MKKLYVGCRVRLIFALNPIEVGATGRIVGFETTKAGTQCLDGIVDVDCDCAVEWDQEPGIFCESTSYLEPIQDPGHEVISWEEMRGLWTPDEVAA